MTPEQQLELFTQDLISIDTDNPSYEVCAGCHRVAIGLAFINDRRYCHGQFQTPTCYEKASQP